MRLTGFTTGPLLGSDDAGANTGGIYNKIDDDAEANTPTIRIVRSCMGPSIRAGNPGPKFEGQKRYVAVALAFPNFLLVLDQQPWLPFVAAEAETARLKVAPVSWRRW